MVLNAVVESGDAKIRTKDVELKENLSFDELLLNKSVLDGLKDAGFLKPSPIQFKAIPLGRLGLGTILNALLSHYFIYLLYFFQNKRSHRSS